MAKFAFPCDDCGTKHDLYMVKHELWANSYGHTLIIQNKCDYFAPEPPDGPTFLCIPCLEKRLGRKLEKVDFTVLPKG